MATPTRVWLKRKWSQAAAAIETAQKYVLEVQKYYEGKYPEYEKLCESNLELLEQARRFLLEARAKT